MKKTYTFGDKFEASGRERYGENEIFILCQTAFKTFSLIGLTSFNRYAEGVRVKDPANITQKELDKMTYNELNTKFVQIINAVVLPRQEMKD